MVEIRRPGDDDNGEISPQEFERMLEQGPDMETVHPGEMVSGKVVSVGRDWVFVDIGTKSEGMIGADEFRDEEGEVTVKIGDTVEATVLTLRGGIHLSRSLKKARQNSDVLDDAYENKIPVEGRVTETRKGGFSVEIGGGISAFCPISQIDSRYVEDGEEYVDRTFSFRIIELSSDQRNIVVSRRSLLEEEQEAQARETRERLIPGEIFDGVVKKVMPYGAFVDVGGVDGLVHVSEISWDRIEDPTEVLSQGQMVKVKVKKFDPVENKLGLSIREAGEDPWDNVEDRFEVSANASGTVTRVEPYGAFVRIASGVEGLVHVSDMSWAGRVRHAGEVVNVGDAVQVVVLNIDSEKKRISLGMKQVHGDPFDAVEERYGVGTPISGRVQRIGAGGVFVELEEGIVAFLPGSLAGVARGEPLGSAYRPGKTVQLMVREIDREKRRITLEAGDTTSAEEKSEFDAYMKKQGVSEFGTFGDLLQKALDKKKKKK